MVQLLCLRPSEASGLKAPVVRGGDPSPHAPRSGKSIELYVKTVPCRNRGYSVNSELTDSSLEMRVIVSASNCAQERARMRLHARASSDKGIVSVTTISSSSDSAMRATAPPESTGCVQ